MQIIPLLSCPLFTAGDGTHLREVIDPTKAEGIRYSVAHASVDPGEASQPHLLLSSEVYYILEGTGVMHIGDEQASVSKGDTIYVPPSAHQFIRNTGAVPLVFLCIVDPAWSAEEDMLV